MTNNSHCIRTLLITSAYYMSWYYICLYFVQIAWPHSSELHLYSFNIYLRNSSKLHYSSNQNIAKQKSKDKSTSICSSFCTFWNISPDSAHRVYFFSNRNFIYIIVFFSFCCDDVSFSTTIHLGTGTTIDQINSAFVFCRIAMLLACLVWLAWHSKTTIRYEMFDPNRYWGCDCGAEATNNT